MNVLIVIIVFCANFQKFVGQWLEEMGEVDTFKYFFFLEILFCVSSASWLSVILACPMTGILTPPTKMAATLCAHLL
jgi:hypothetical protein